MNTKYEVHNPLTGVLEEALSFIEAKALVQRLKEEYIKAQVDPLFSISVLLQNEDGSWTQSLAGDSGEPLTNIETPTLGPLT